MGTVKFNLPTLLYCMYTYSGGGLSVESGAFVVLFEGLQHAHPGLHVIFCGGGEQKHSTRGVDLEDIRIRVASSAHKHEMIARS